VAPRAELSRRLVGAPPPRWGHWVDVKTNAREVLEGEVRTLPPGIVRMSPILTDPYQPVEKRYRVTRGCLEVLLGAGFTPLVLTREARALEDLPLLRGKRAAIGYSIPTDDDRVRAIFEPGADPIDERIAALRAFAEAGIATALVVQPVLPMDADRFVSLLAPWTRVVRIDRLHFGEAFADHFRRAGAPADPTWVDETIRRLEAGFRAAGARIDEADDLAGVLDSLL
jgi:DNA repair photolyase